MARASFAVAKDVTKPARGPDIRVGGPRRPDQPRQRRDAEAAKPPGVALLHGFALPFADDILGALGDITVQAQFPCMTTPSPYVSRDDQLRRGRVAERPRRLPLQSN